MSLLDGIQFLGSLTQWERDTLGLYCQERLLRAGEVLFYEGDDAVAFYVVKSGTLKAYKDRSEGEKVLGYINPGDIAGEMALFDPDAPKARTANVKAMEDSLLLVIMDYAVLELSKKHPEIYNKILTTIQERKKKKDE